MDFFAQCIICDQGLMDFDQLDSHMVCGQKSCQSKKNRIIDMATIVCRECGIKFVIEHICDMDICEHCE